MNEEISAGVLVMLRQLFFGLLVLTACVCVLPVFGEPGSLFEPAPRGDDGRFTNRGGDIGHGTLGVRVPFMLRRFGTYFRSGDDAPETVANDGQFLRDNARHSVPTVTWIGHATLLVQMEHLTFLTDPIWSERPSPVPLIGPKRFVKPGVSMQDLPPIDFVVISHNHYDHLDLPTLLALAQRNTNTRFFVPIGNADLLRQQGIDNVEELDWGETAKFKQATIHSLPSQHWSKRSLMDDNKALWSSWAVTGDERRFYFAGDTGYFSGFKDIGNRLGPFDLVAVPVGAYEPVAMMHEAHMNPEEAVAAAIDLKANRALAIHFGTFDLSDEPLTEPPRRFAAAVKSSALGDSSGWILKIGETRLF